MIVTTSQRDVKIEVPAGKSKVGIKMSGGTNSALMAYMYAKHKVDENSNISLIPIIIDIAEKPFIQSYVENNIAFIESALGITFEPIQKSTIVIIPNKVAVENAFVASLYASNIIDCHALGATEIPPLDEYKGFFEEDALKREQIDIEHEEISYQENNMVSLRPFMNINKAGIKELYDHYDLTGNLFPSTKSCIAIDAIESAPNSYSNDPMHCGFCWYCRQRAWGFGAL